MSVEQHKNLVDRLSKKTNERTLRWETTVDDDAFQVVFSRNSVKITQVYNGFTDSTDFRIDLINSDGQVVDSFTDVDLTSSAATVGVNWFTKMKNLYESARRRALGSDEVLDDIMRELD